MTSKIKSRPRRVLSIQSHVVSGYVGNKAATFPLQILGFDVDPLNSVHFSNHTGHSDFLGQILNGEELKEIFDSLKKNELLHGIGHILTGYVGSASFLKNVGCIIKTMKESCAQKVDEKPLPRYICDPVLGDGGKLYVPPELIKIYLEDIIPLADVVTPNQTEVEFLTKIKIRNLDDAVLACKKLHSMGPELVVITSIEFPDSMNNCEENDVVLFGSRRMKMKKDSYEIYKVNIPKIPGRYTGTGDLCAALLLAHTSHLMEHQNENIGPVHKPSEDAKSTGTTTDTRQTDPNVTLADILQNVAATMFSVIKRTYDFSCLAHSKEDIYEKKKFVIKSNELRLIQSKGDIEHPPSVASLKLASTSFVKNDSSHFRSMRICE